MSVDRSHFAETGVNELEQFLSKNTIRDAGNLPLVHTTRAYHLRSLAKTGL